MKKPSRPGALQTETTVVDATPRKRAQDLLLDAVGIDRGVGERGEPWAVLGERTDALPAGAPRGLDAGPDYRWRIFRPLEPGQELLDQSVMIDLILLLDAAEIDPADAADIFGLPVDDVTAFLDATHGPAPIATWVEALDLDEDDAEHLQRMTDVVLDQYLAAEDAGIPYPDHMRYLAYTLDVCREMGASQIEDEDGNILADKQGLFLLMAKMGYRDEVYEEWLSRATGGWE